MDGQMVSVRQKEGFHSLTQKVLDVVRVKGVQRGSLCQEVDKPRYPSQVLFSHQWLTFMEYRLLPL